MTTYRILPLFLLSAGTLTGCSAGLAGYPSLAQRPIERAVLASPAPGGAETPPAVPALPPQIEAVVAKARSAGADVAARLAEMRPIIEKGRTAAPGSENWVAAQQAYSAVDTVRGEIATALADLDRMHREAVAAGDAGQLAAVESAIGLVQAIDAQARAALEPLQPIAG